ncbi:1074_t:CDS:2 [Entrophospora sp. SA101]|nr:1074_t:CDS:2 [Entrophospora sp. SA101]
MDTSTLTFSDKSISTITNMKKSLMPYSFDLGINIINNNSYKSTEKIPVEKPLMPYKKITVEKSLMPYSFDLGINTVNNNSHKTKEKIPAEKSLMPYSFDLVGVGNNSTITMPSISVNKKE